MGRFKEAVTEFTAAIEAEKNARDDEEAEVLHAKTVIVAASVLDALPETADDVADGLQIVHELCINGDVPVSEQLPRHLIESSIAALRVL